MTEMSERESSHVVPVTCAAAEVPPAERCGATTVDPGRGGAAHQRRNGRRGHAYDGLNPLPPGPHRDRQVATILKAPSRSVSTISSPAASTPIPVITPV